MGNILRLKHTGSSDFTRIFNPDSGNMPDDYGNKNLLNEVKIGGTTYSSQYDANGNLIQENANRFYEWDAADQMRCFYLDDGSTITKHAHYLYDAAGNRVKKLVRVDGGNYTSNTYIDGIVEYRTDGTDEQSIANIMDDQSRIATVRAGDDFGDTTPAIKYVLEDHLGSSVVEMASSGASVNREEYFPFGETSFGSYSKKRYKFCGKERDHESGLYYYGARYYCAWCCRFINVDDLTHEFPFYTSYQYAGNKPIIAIDLDGKEEYIVVHYENKGRLVATNLYKIPEGNKVDKASKSIIYKAIEIDSINGKGFTEFFVEKVSDKGNWESFLLQDSNWKSDFEHDESQMIKHGGLENQALHETKIKEFEAFEEGKYVMTILEPLPENVTFETNEAILTEEGKKELGLVANKLKLIPDMNLELVGHTDDVGSEESNQTLSMNRANAAMQYLIDVEGIDPNRLSASGRGLNEPIDTNATEDGRKINRRVEFQRK